MPGPKSRVSRSRRGMRRSHHSLKPQAIIHCPSCQSLIRPHRACPYCGVYKGRQVVVVPTSSEATAQ